MSLALAIVSTSYVLMPDYRIVDDKQPILLEGYYRQAKGADITTKPYKGSKLKFSDYDAGVNYTYTINPEHFLNLGLGTYHNRIDWDENPAFLGKNYDYVVGSIGITSLGVEKWRWTGTSVLSFQTQNFGIKESGWISVQFWGEYFINQKAHFHVGFWGYTGVRNVYFLPIIGFDYKGSKGELSVVFPFDIAVRYKPTKNFHMEIAGKWFGGPYRFPQRMQHGINGYENGIFQIFEPITELGLYYHPSSHINIGITGGYTWGGWLEVRNKKNHHLQYFSIDSAPYASASATFRF